MHTSSSANIVPSIATPVSVSPVARKTQPAPNALALLKALRRRWLLAVFCGLMGSALAAAGVWFGMPVKYTASTVLHVSSREPRILGGEAQGGNDFMAYQKSQAALVTSRLVLNAALKEPAMARLNILPSNPDELIDWLQLEIKVDFKMGPEFMKLSMVGYQAEEMKKLLNTVTETYLKEVVNKERNRKQAHLLSLKEILSRYENLLREKRETVKRLVIALGSSDAQVLAVKQRYANEALGSTQKELLQVQSDLRKLKLNLKYKEGKEKGGTPAPEIPASQVEQVIDREPAIIPLLTKVEELKKDLEQAAGLMVAGMNAPQLSSRKARLKATEAALKTARDRLRPAVKEQLLERLKGDRTISAAELKDRIAIAEDLEKSLAESADHLRKETYSTNVNQADVEGYKLEIAQAEKLTERVAAEVSFLEVEVDAPKRVESFEEASASLGALERQRTKATAGAAVGALLLIVGFISWREFRQRRFDSAHELINDLGMKVVGTLPALPSTTRSLLPWRAADSEDAANRLTESIDATRTNLLHAAREQDARVVLVTSALGGEGKTSLSCHLAASLARAGFRTLLIDGDMRQPSIHEALNIDANEGLSELLRQEIELEKVIHTSEIDHLWVIGAGHWCPAATAALARTRLPNLLKTLRERYEYVIIDSAPLLPVVDSLLLGQHVDGVVLSVLREVSQLPLVSSAAERLESVGIRILGVIANGVRSNLQSYRYGSYGNYGDRPNSSTQIDPVEPTSA